MTRCYDIKGECFARRGNKCDILNGSLLPCPFKKPERMVTNGVLYPYNPRGCSLTSRQADDLKVRLNE